mgnify:CR=1 FL=1
MLAGRFLKTGLTGLLLVSLALGQASTPAASLPGPLDVPRLTFTKTFHDSQPAFVQITVTADRQAAAEVRETADQPPVNTTFIASPALTARLFALAGELHYFAKPRLESKAKVGYLGEKMLAYDDPAHHGQQVFNFTQVRAAAELTQIFERISNAADHAARLEHVLRYDRLGVIRELARLQEDWNSHQLAAPQVLFPVLTEIAADKALLHVARHRAATLLQEMQTAE